MGNPVSWPLLCAYTNFLHIASTSSGWYATVGDDYVGSHTRRSNLKWTNALIRTGGTFSVPKDMLSNSGFGILAEELISLPRRRHYATVSVRAAAGVAKSDEPLWAMGPSLHDSLAALSGEGKKQVIYMNFGDIIKRFTAAGVDPHAPRWLGGAGFPGGDPTNKTLSLARGLLGQSDVYLAEKLVELAVPWSTSLSQPVLSNEARLTVPRLILEFGVRAERTEDRAQTVDQVVATWSAIRAPAYALFMGKRERSRLSFKGVCDRITKSIKELAERCFWIDPKETIKAPRSLVEAILAREPRFVISPVGLGRSLAVTLEPTWG